MCAILKYLGFVSFCSHGEDLLKIPGLQNSSNNSKTKCWKYIFLNDCSNKNSTSPGHGASQESTTQLHNFSSFFFPTLRLSVVGEGGKGASQSSKKSAFYVVPKPKGKPHGKRLRFTPEKVSDRGSHVFSFQFILLLRLQHFSFYFSFSRLYLLE